MTVVYSLLGALASLVVVASAIPSTLRWIRRRRARGETEHAIAERLRRKQEFLSHLPPKGEYQNRGDAIIRDIRRADRYPEIDDRWWDWRISSWFKVELKDVYHRGVEVFISVDYVIVDERHKTWRTVRGGQKEGAFKGFVVGRIPFDWIVSVDWDGDEYYGPQIYCRFDGQRRQPYEEIVVYYKSADSDFLYQLNGFHQERHWGWRVTAPVVHLVHAWRIRQLRKRAAADVR